MSKLNIRKRFLQLAYNQLNPSINSIEGLDQALTNWYCFQYNVSPLDDKLLSMTTEELLVLQQMHQLRENPHLADEITSEAQSYEDWLKQEMGEEYITTEQMIESVEELDKEEAEIAAELKAKYPDRITTDFASVSNSEE